MRNAEITRHDWNLAEIRTIYEMPFLDLVFRAAVVHRQFHSANQVQLSTLLSIKTGGCPEDCAYCPQSAHYDTVVDNEPMLDLSEVVEAARQAKVNGSSRFCMGAAWRTPPSEARFAKVLDMVREVKAVGLETCCTLGMVNYDQARRLKAAGLDYYNHNLDTSPEFYEKIITTRSYEDRLRTLAAVREANIHVCCGGILGLGEDADDVCRFLLELAHMNPHPESVPINTLVSVPGTPLQDQTPVEALELVRTIATARILMPTSIVRLSAGRTRLSEEAHALAFLAGANSIFSGEKLLTTPNPGEKQDGHLLGRLGLQPMPVTEC